MSLNSLKWAPFKWRQECHIFPWLKVEFDATEGSWVEKVLTAGLDVRSWYTPVPHRKTKIVPWGLRVWHPPGLIKNKLWKLHPLTEINDYGSIQTYGTQIICWFHGTVKAHFSILKYFFLFLLYATTKSMKACFCRGIKNNGNKVLLQLYNSDFFIYFSQKLYSENIKSELWDISLEFREEKSKLSAIHLQLREKNYEIKQF